MYRPRALACLVLLASTAGLPQDGPAEIAQPLKALPEGWLHLPEFCTDCWIGGYHDRESGTYVRYSVVSASTAALSPSKGQNEQHRDQTSRGVLEGIKYENTTFTNARAVVRGRLERLAGEPADELIDAVKRTIPPDGCGLLSVTFFVEKERWRFDATTCDASQEKRVRGLLLEKLRLDRSGAGKIAHSRALSPSTYNALTIGTTCAALMHDIGRPEGSYQTSKDGFALLYGMYLHPGTQESPVEARFFFDRLQRLIRKELDQPAPKLPQR